MSRWSAEDAEFRPGASSHPAPGRVRMEEEMERTA
jgi:hypothetical protein